MDENYNIFIPTRGRVDVQKTWDWLSPELQARTFLICPKEEVSAHEDAGRNAIPRPESCKYISDVRQYMVSLSGGEDFIMSDDDLRFCCRIEGTTDLRQARTHEDLVLMLKICLLYTSPSPRDRQKSRMPSSA